MLQRTAIYRVTAISSSNFTPPEKNNPHHLKKIKYQIMCSYWISYILKHSIPWRVFLNFPSICQSFCFVTDFLGGSQYYSQWCIQAHATIYCGHSYRLRFLTLTNGVCGDAVGWDTALQAGRLWVWFLIVSLEFFIDIILSGCTMALGSTQPLTEMNTRNASWGIEVASA
jgi:hypothetical protein